MEVKIGVSDSPRELVFTSSQTAAEVEELVTSALSKAGSDVLSLSDDKGRRFLVHTAKISYVEIGVSDVRRVGFGIGAGEAEVGVFGLGVDAASEWEKEQEESGAHGAMLAVANSRARLTGLEVAGASLAEV